MSDTPSSKILWFAMGAVALVAGVVLYRRLTTGANAQPGGVVYGGSIVPVSSNINPILNTSGSTQLAGAVSGRLNLGLSTGFDVLTASEDPGTIHIG